MQAEPIPVPTWEGWPEPMADHVKTVRQLTKRINEATEPEDRAALSDQLADHWKDYKRQQSR